jgi:hypothetical protein
MPQFPQRVSVDSSDIHQLNDVFGLSRGLPRIYVWRERVDDRFLEELAREKHVVVHGSSKQGKTSLRKRHLRDDAHIYVQCTRDLSRAKIYEMILKFAGVKVRAVYGTTASDGSKYGGGGEAAAKLPFFGSAKAEVSIERQRSAGESISMQDLELDLNDPNDVIRVLDAVQFRKRIVIEDFHYLDEEVQRAFAFDLKVFHEISGILFVVIGVWLETNRLIMFNGDLSGRISTVDADKWSEDELRQVIRKGAALLNIDIPGDVQRALITRCQNNVGLLQEACYRLCRNAGLRATSQTRRSVGTVRAADEIYNEMVASEASRYLNFLVAFAEGLSDTKFEIYKWIAWAIITAEPNELRSGLPVLTIYKRVVSKHRSGNSIQQNTVSKALDRVGIVQYKHKLQPLIFDYDGSRLRIVDANFIAFLEVQQQDELLQAIGLRTGKAR